MKQKKVTILGEGAWGTALALLCAHKGYAVTLWCYHKTVVSQIIDNRINAQFLPDIHLDESIVPTNDLQKAVFNADIIIEAIPVAFLESVLSLISVAKSTVWIVTSKGIQEQTNYLPTDIVYKTQHSTNSVVLAGPTFAHEIAHKKPTCFLAAGVNEQVLPIILDLFSSEYSCIAWSTDMVGVQLCAALKNVVAIALGMLRGVGLGENIQAAAITAFLQEIVQLVQAAGGNKETVYGLAGVGDLILTSLSCKSRNTRLGEKLAQGFTVDEARAQISGVSEGAATIQSLPAIMKKYQIVLPLFLVVHEIVFHGAPIKKLVDALIIYQWR